MQTEIEKGMRPANVPVRYRYEPVDGGVTAGPWTGSAPVINHHHGDVVTIDGNNNLVAVGNHGPVEQHTAEQADNQWRLDLLAALGNVQNRLDELDLDDDDRDTIEDAATSAAAIAADHGDDEVDDTAMRRRGCKVLNILEKIGTAASGGVLAHELPGRSSSSSADPTNRQHSVTVQRGGRARPSHEHRPRPTRCRGEEGCIAESEVSPLAAAPATSRTRIGR